LSTAISHKLHNACGILRRMIFILFYIRADFCD
jgi:hypothetical protein